MGFVEVTRVASTTVIRYENGERLVGSKKWCDGHGSYRSDIKSVEVVVPNSTDKLWLCHECATDSEKQLLKDRDEGL